jgi:hypothetical protein
MLGEELLQSHLELEGDVVDDDIHPSEGPLFPHFMLWFDELQLVCVKCLLIVNKVNY